MGAMERMHCGGIEPPTRRASTDCSTSELTVLGPGDEIRTRTNGLEGQHANQLTPLRVKLSAGIEPAFLAYEASIAPFLFRERKPDERIELSLRAYKARFSIQVDRA